MDPIPVNNTFSKCKAASGIFRFLKNSYLPTSRLRQRIISALLICYFVPLSLLCLYSSLQIPLHTGWIIFSCGLFAALGGAALLFILLLQWEKSFTKSEEADEDCMQCEKKEVLDQRVKSLIDEVERLKYLSEELQRGKEKIEQEQSELQQALENHHVVAEKELEEKKILLDQYQSTIAQQRDVIDKKEQRLALLQEEIRDLKYELKTVVEISEKTQATFVQDPPSSPVKTYPVAEPPSQNRSSLNPHEEAYQQLKRCIDIAQKLTGARHLAGDSSRFRNLSGDGYALDLRRFCDSFRNEQSSVIILYSPTEGKTLFVNNLVKSMLGIPPDKFLQNFPHLLLTANRQKWNFLVKEALNNYKVEDTLRVREHTIQCIMGAIPTGIFKDHIIAIFYLKSENRD